MNDNLSPYSAAEYEEGIRKTLPFYEVFFSETINLVNYLKPGVTVWLDTGCGTGSLISRAHPVFPNTTFLLSDPSSEMLGKAKEALKGILGGSLKIVGNVRTENLPAITPNRPQVITAILVHHYSSKEERYAATKKCYELLVDDGLYITFENMSPVTEDGKRIALGRWKAFQLSQGKTEEEANSHVGRYGKSYFPISIEEHMNILKACGFRIVELFWFSIMQAGLYGIK